MEIISLNPATGDVVKSYEEMTVEKANEIMSAMLDG